MRGHHRGACLAFMKRIRWFRTRPRETNSLIMLVAFRFLLLTFAERVNEAEMGHEARSSGWASSSALEDPLIRLRDSFHAVIFACTRCEFCRHASLPHVNGASALRTIGQMRPYSPSIGRWSSS